MESQHIIDINDEIYELSLMDPSIDYTGRNDYPTIRRKIVELVRMTPNDSLINIATYYLKFIILLQPFADANHRTALISVRLFLYNNGFLLKYTPEDAEKWQKKLYHIRPTYESQETDILTQPKDEIFNHCKKFIEDHIIPRL